MNSHSFCGKASKFGLLNKTWGRPSSLYINRFPVLLMLVNRRTTCAPMNWRTECSAMAAGSRKQTAPVYQRTTAAAEVERSWSSIRSLVYVASADETDAPVPEGRYHACDVGCTRVDANQGMARTIGWASVLGIPKVKMTRLRGGRKAEATGHCWVLK